MILKSATGQGANNIQAKRALYLDVDVGDMGYDTLDAVHIAVRNFIVDTKLPEPSVVCSGNGLHIWWPLDEAISPDKWLHYGAEAVYRDVRVVWPGGNFKRSSCPHYHQPLSLARSIDGGTAPVIRCRWSLLPGVSVGNDRSIRQGQNITQPCGSRRLRGGHEPV